MASIVLHILAFLLLLALLGATAAYVDSKPKLPPRCCRRCGCPHAVRELTSGDIDCGGCLFPWNPGEPLHPKALDEDLPSPRLSLSADPLCPHCQRSVSPLAFDCPACGAALDALFVDAIGTPEPSDDYPGAA